VTSELDRIRQEQKAIEAQIVQVQQKLGALEADLRNLDAELEALGDRREQYELLLQICSALDRLDELGASRLFWGGRLGEDVSTDHVVDIRARVEEFSGQFDKVGGRREEIVREIREVDEVLAYLEDSLLDLKEAEEHRRSEWQIEREPEEEPFRKLVMPWARGFEEDDRFRKSMLVSAAVSALLAFLIGIIDLPIPDRDELLELPERVANLIRQEPEPPPPAVVEEQLPEPEPLEAEDEPVEELVADEQPPEVTPEASDEPAPAPVPEENPQQQVRSKGILAFRDSFSERAKGGPSAQLGASARIGNAGDAAVGLPTRSMVTTQGPGSSGGINLAEISRDVGGGGGGGMDGVQVTRVASSIGGDGSADRPLSGGPSAGRTDEEIQIVFDRYKAALYRLYNRELRRDPTLRGQMILKLTIEPDGTVSMCILQSSDMEAPTLADQVVERVLGFDFGAKDGIVAMTIIYPIDFLPAS